MGDRWAAARGKSRITLQHLRHYAATAMLDAGESYRTVADILGNSEATLRLHYEGRNDTGKAPSHCRSGAGRRLTTSPTPNQRHHRDRDHNRRRAMLRKHETLSVKHIVRPIIT